MSELRTRRPAVFRYDDPAVVATLPATVAPVELPSPPESQRRRPWVAMFWIGAFGLAVLATGLAVVNLIEDLASRAAWLGGLGVVMAGLAAVALLVIVAREVIALARLSEIESLHKRGITVEDLENVTKRVVTETVYRDRTVATPQPAPSPPRQPSDWSYTPVQPNAKAPAPQWDYVALARVFTGVFVLALVSTLVDCCMNAQLAPIHGGPRRIGSTDCTSSVPGSS